jgi:hypothetical protein
VRIVVVLAIVLAATPARADDTVAQEAFRRAQALAAEKPPRWAEACPLYEASYKADPQIGVLLYLADCHEHLGHTASAWSEFTDAADLAHQRGDNREGIARSRADQLAPKLARLHLSAPPAMIDGLAVQRDGVDITVLVGSDMAIDPGPHQITATAPGYVTWRTEVTITSGVQRLDIPVLVKETAPIERPHEGSLTVHSQPDAAITIDGMAFGTGTATGKLKSGGHTLRVVAPHMLPFQTEVQIGIDETRTIEVPLEPALAIAAPHEAPTATYELGASLMSGIKLRHEDPIVLAVRAELALRFGHRVNFGVMFEYGEIGTAKGCGFDIPGPDPSTPFDVGPRTQMTKCTYVMPGVQLYIHLKPGAKIDPYVGIAPGFRFGFVGYTPFLAGQMAAARSDMFPAIVTGVRGGVTYHPKLGPTSWHVGAYVEGSITLFGQEAANAFTENDSAGTTFLTVFAGVRSTFTF